MPYGDEVTFSVTTCWVNWIDSPPRWRFAMYHLSSALLIHETTGTEIILDEYREYDYSEYGGVGPAFRNGVYLQLQHWGGDLHTTQLSEYCPSDYGHPDPIHAQRDFQLSDNWNSLHPTFKTTQPRKKDKQLMACLSCRERKIGCVRPEKNSPDQTCKQCARRERKCEYPTASRRGQHTKTRFRSKKNEPAEPAAPARK
ncbi:hypothetical protein B0H13DRAFT_2576964 [Mycena leptocephala]|nr:hypothetical protein B0H13DRAFT_2576964 [Mycena leptocephala]